MTFRDALKNEWQQHGIPTHGCLSHLNIYGRWECPICHPEAAMPAKKRRKAEQDYRRLRADIMPGVRTYPKSREVGYFFEHVPVPDKKDWLDSRPCATIMIRTRPQRYISIDLLDLLADVIRRRPDFIEEAKKQMEKQKNKKKDD